MASLSSRISCYGVLDRPRIFHTLGSIQNLQAHNVAVFVIVENHTGLVFVAFFNPCVAEENTQDIYLRVISDFHVTLQYMLILLVRYTVTTIAGSTSSST